MQRLTSTPLYTTDRWFVFTVVIEPFIIRGGGCNGSYLGLIGLIIPYYLCYPGLLAFITFCIIVTNKDIFLDIYWMLPIHVIYHVSGGKGGDGIRTRYCSLGAGLLCFWPLSANCQCSGAFFTSLCLLFLCFGLFKISKYRSSC